MMSSKNWARLNRKKNRSWTTAWTQCGTKYDKKGNYQQQKLSILSYFSNSARFATGYRIWSQIRGMRSDTKPSWVQFHQVRTCKKLPMTHAFVPAAKGWTQPQAYVTTERRLRQSMDSTQQLFFGTRKLSFIGGSGLMKNRTKLNMKIPQVTQLLELTKHVPGTLAEVLTGNHFLLGRKSVKFSSSFQPFGQRVSAGVSKLHSACPMEQLGKNVFLTVFFIFWQ